MPYRKNYRRRTYRKRPITYRQIGSKLWKDVQYLKSIVNVERKHLEQASSTTSSTTAAFILLNGCAPGDTGETRDGQSIKVSAVFLRYTLIQNASATSGTVNRLILFMDKQCNGAAPTAADILDSSANVLSPLNINNGKRFKVMADIIVNTDLVAAPIKTIERYLKTNFHTKYNAGTAGTVADITTNSLYVMHMSSEATNVPTFNYSFRTRFIDN